MTSTPDVLSYAESYGNTRGQGRLAQAFYAAIMNVRGHNLEQGPDRLTSFDSILQAPNLHIIADNNEYYPLHYNTDLDQHTAYTSALGQMHYAVKRDIESSPTLQELLSRDTWSKQDRVMWEQNVSLMVSKRMEEIPGLKTYRTAGIEYNGHTAHIRPENMDDLSQDIVDNTKILEFDCKGMSYTEGRLLEEMDRHFLPESSGSENYKKASGYYYAIGYIYQSAKDGQQEGVMHAFIVSRATGNIIESTWSGHTHPYMQADDPNHTIDDYVNRGLFSTQEGQIVYTMFQESPETIRNFVQVARFAGALSNLAERAQDLSHTAEKLVTHDVFQTAQELMNREIQTGRLLDSDSRDLLSDIIMDNPRIAGLHIDVVRSGGFFLKAVEQAAHIAGSNPDLLHRLESATRQHTAKLSASLTQIPGSEIMRTDLRNASDPIRRENMLGAELYQRVQNIWQGTIPQTPSSAAFSPSHVSPDYAPAMG